MCIRDRKSGIDGLSEDKVEYAAENGLLLMISLISHCDIRSSEGFDTTNAIRTIWRNICLLYTSRCV